MRRKTFSEGQMLDLPRAVPDLLGLHAHAIQQRQIEIGHRRLARVDDVAPDAEVSPRPATSTGKSSWLCRLPSLRPLP